jgi:PPOX class probable F420-dependent enzyme
VNILAHAPRTTNTDVVYEPQTTPAIVGKHLSLTTFRRDGTGVATPVWFVREGPRLLVETDADSYKVRRIRRNASVTVASCTATSKVRGEQMPANAELLADSETGRVEQLTADNVEWT